MIDASVVESGVKTVIQKDSDNYFKVEKRVFLQKTPFYTKLAEVVSELPMMKQLNVSQGSGIVTDENILLNSKYFGDCIALILENMKSKKTALFHIDAKRQNFLDMEKLNQISEGGGLVIIQAVRGSKGITSKDIIEMISNNIWTDVLVAEDLQIDTGQNFWDITCFPNKHELYIHVDGESKTLKYLQQIKQLPTLEKVNPTNIERLVSAIIKDTNIYSFLTQLNYPSLNEILESINYFVTFATKENSEWINRWIISSKEEKQMMVNQITQSLNLKHKQI